MGVLKIRVRIPNLLLLGRVALGAQRPMVVKLSRERFVGRSVGRSVCRSVCLSSALWKNSGSDPDTVWHHRLDGSRNEACSGVWGSVTGRGSLGANLGRAIVINGDFMAYVSDSAATRPSSQITLDRLDLFYCSISPICNIRN